ncbi:MAG: Pycsar system effector family protein [Bacteroidota bacterium]
MNPLIDKTEGYVEQLLMEKLPSTCLYHNLTHTKRVFKSTKEIIDNISISEEDSQILLLATLLHDIGYVDGCEDHEAKGAALGEAFLRQQGLDEATIERVSQCILATKFDAEPTNELEKIIRDADASHFAKDYFQEASEFLRLEWKMQGREDYSKRKWLENNIDLLQNRHEYYTDYARKHWAPKKEENIQLMITEKEQLDQQKKAKDKAREKKDKAKLKSVDPEKAIQSVFRVTLRNHIKLSDIADTKANILLSVNAIILSIALSNLIPKLDNASNTYLIVPTIIFLLFTVISMGLSVLATRPNVTSGKFTKEDVTNKKVNLLFFGNFHKMSLNEFQWAMNEMLNDKEYIYSSLTKDLYFLGLVLQRKYTILRLTYTIFMIGIIVSVAAFAISFLITDAAGLN